MDEELLAKRKKDYNFFMSALKLKGGIKMGKLILKTNIPREKNFIYYCGTGDDGNLTVCKAEMSRGGRKKKVEKKVKK